MSVLKVLLLAAAVATGLWAVAEAAPRARYQFQAEPAPALGRYGSQPAPTSGGGGYSSNPQTRDLQILADKYKPGW
jgi:hypothetical protein